MLTGPNNATTAGAGTDSRTIESGTSAVTTFTANEPISSWSLSGTNAGLFDITSGGVLTLQAPGVVGTYVVNVTGTDASGNFSVMAFTLTVTDTTKPVLTGPNASTTAGAGTDSRTIESGTTAVTTFTANEPISSWTLSGTDAALFNITSDGVLTLQAPGVVGTYVVNVTGTDASGNFSTMAFTLTVTDSTKPVLNGPNNSTTAGAGTDSRTIEAGTTAVTTFTANEPVSWTLSGANAALFDITSGGVLTLKAPGVVGTYVVDIIGTDASGNFSTMAFTLTVTDTTKPVLTGPNTSTSDGTGSDTATIEARTTAVTTFTATEPVTWTLAGANAGLFDITRGGVLSLRGPAVVGTYVVNVTGTDASGNAAVMVFTLRVIDTEGAIEQSFTDVTSAFIQRRMDRLLSAEPRAHHLERRREATSALQFSVNHDTTSGELASHLQLAGRLGQAPTGGLDVSASDASPATQLSFAGNFTSRDRSWYFWTEGQYSSYTDATGPLEERKGGFGIVFIGVDYLVNERLAFGVMALADKASESIDGHSDVSGTGWMVGPYVSGEITEDLFFTGRMAWGQSSNTAAIDVFSDDVLWSGDFETRRFLARGALYGRFDLGQAQLTPQVDLAYMRETQGGYLVTDGNSEVLIAGTKAEIGRLSLSMEVDWPTGSGAMTAFVIPKLDWDFHNSASSQQSDDTRGSLEFGLRTSGDAGWRGEAAARYDGIGQAGFEAWNLRLGAQIDF